MASSVQGRGHSGDKAKRALARGFILWGCPGFVVIWQRVAHSAEGPVMFSRHGSCSGVTALVAFIAKKSNPSSAARSIVNSPPISATYRFDTHVSAEPFGTLGTCVVAESRNDKGTLLGYRTVWN